MGWVRVRGQRSGVSTLLPRPNTQDLFPGDYNSGVQPSDHESDASHKHHHRHAVYASETMGLLLIAFILLILTIVRYWQAVHWSLH